MHIVLILMKMEKKRILCFLNYTLKIFKKLGIKVVPVRAPAGEIGGNLSHEFHLIVESGESEIYIDESDNFRRFK